MRKRALVYMTDPETLKRLRPDIFQFSERLVSQQAARTGRQEVGRMPTEFNNREGSASSSV